MNARDIMTTDAAYCLPETNLASAAASMWERNCGVLPVVDENMHVKGMITDRDICIALATRDRLASEVTVGEVSSGIAFACRPDNNIQTVLSTMRHHRVRRVPIVEEDGRLAGIVSIDDLARFARARRDAHYSGVTFADVIEAHKAMTASPLPSISEEKGKGREPAAEPVIAHTGDFDFEE